MLIVKKNSPKNRSLCRRNENLVNGTLKHPNKHTQNPRFCIHCLFPPPYQCIIVAILLLWRGKQTLENKRKHKTLWNFLFSTLVGKTKKLKKNCNKKKVRSTTRIKTHTHTQTHRQFYRYTL